MFFVVNRNVSSIPSTADQKTQLFGNLVSQQKRQENSTQLLQFIRKLNTITCTLDLSGSIGHFALTLDTLVTFLNEWNHRFFSKVAVQLDLILMLSRSPPIL